MRSLLTASRPVTEFIDSSPEVKPFKACILSREGCSWCVGWGNGILTMFLDLVLSLRTPHGPGVDCTYVDRVHPRHLWFDINHQGRHCRAYDSAHRQIIQSPNLVDRSKFWLQPGNKFGRHHMYMASNWLMVSHPCFYMTGHLQLCFE